MNFKIDEDIDLIQKNKILVDYDDKGILFKTMNFRISPLNFQ